MFPYYTSHSFFSYLQHYHCFHYYLLSRIIMGRENHDPTVFHSSIALLQERFRQLQRVKEMREERELQKMLNEPKQLFNSNTNISNYDPTRLLSSHSEFIKPSTRSPPHVSLSLWPTSHANNQDYNTRVQNHTSGSINTDYNYAHSHSLQQGSWNNIYDCDSDSGVDTSLHL